MKKHLLVDQERIDLPNIELVESKPSFSAAFLSAAQTLYRYLQQITSSLESIEDYIKDPFNLAILCLFSKMSRTYYSYSLLEIHQDHTGSQFLLEHLSESAITITHLLEEGDQLPFSEYVSTSIHQARFLLQDVEEQLRHIPAHPNLLILRDKLRTFVAAQQQQVAELLLNQTSEASSWGPKVAETADESRKVTGLDFLSNPARRIALGVLPGSWLDLQLNYLAPTSKEEISTNFRTLRDASHLCLHATRTLLEEVAEYQDSLKLKRQQQLLNKFYEWFYNAYNAYHRNFVTTVHTEVDCNYC